ncbi:MAG TPA: hypothetical protein VFV83_00150 [Chthoniobacteraceae bacterium]|nr:hypothetical protein [Chthoniobacteraceae bacterium]
MKKVLSLLLAFVFLHVQAHALSGGPVFAGSASTSLIGTYSGVLTGPTNALGIFVVGIRDVGPAEGDFNIFIGGAFYGGTIIGIGDPGDSSFQGVVQGEQVSDFSFFNDSFFGFNSGSATIEGTAAGLVDAVIEAGGSAFAGISGTRMTGTATVDVRERQPTTTTTDANGNQVTTGGGFKKVGSLNFSVDGFKQSDDGNASQAAALQNFGSGTGAAGG